MNFRWKNTLFFIVVLSCGLLCESTFGKEKNNLKQCREHIREAICLVDPVDYENPFATQYNRPCLSGGEKFTSIFESHFDNSSPVIQRMYCSLEKIWVENSLITTAYATPIYDLSDKLVAAAIGIKRDFLERPLSLSEWFSQKEITTFGGAEGLITYETQMQKKNFDAISYAINHEFGHIFDYANKINQYEEDCQLDISPKECIPKKGSWGAISWKNAKVPKVENDFPLRGRLCFYQCGGEYLDHEDSTELFEALIKTNFQSTYASINPKEDWAEAFALTLLSKEGLLFLEAQTHGQVFKLHEHFHSKKLKEKRNFVESFLKSSFKYPGN